MPLFRARLTGRTVVGAVTFAALAIAVGGPVGAAMAAIASPDPQGHTGLAVILEQYAGLRAWRLLATTALTATGSTLVATVLGLTIGYACERGAPWGRGLLPYAVAPAFLAPPYVMAMAWIAILGQSGLARDALRFTLNYEAPLPPVFGRFGLVWVQGAGLFPIVGLLFGAALRRLDRRPLEAAILVCGRRRAVWGVAMPMLWPAVLAGMLVSLLLAMQSYAVASLLQVEAYPVEVYARFSAFHDIPGAISLALPLAAMGGVAAVGASIAGRRSTAWLSGGSRPFDGPAPPPGRRAIWTLLVWGIVGITVVLPLGVVFGASLPLSVHGAMWATVKSEWALSGALAAISATTATLLAFSVVLLRRGSALWRGLGEATGAAFLLSGPVVGIGLVFLLNQPNALAGAVYNSAAVLVWAWTAQLVWPVLHVLAPFHAHTALSLDEAAAVSGASWIRRAVLIAAPVSAPALTLVWCGAFVMAFREVDAAVLVAPPGVTPVAVRLYTLMHYGPDRMVSALAVLLTATLLVAAAAAALTAACLRNRLHAWR